MNDPPRPFQRPPPELPCAIWPQLNNTATVFADCHLSDEELRADGFNALAMVDHEAMRDLVYGLLPRTLPLLTGLFWQLTVFTHFFKDELYESRIQ